VNEVEQPPTSGDPNTGDPNPSDPTPDDVLAGQRALRTGAGAPLDRDVVRVAGPDAASYLHGQLSADVESLAPGDGVWSLLLEPTGKLGWWLRVSRLDTITFVLDVDRGQGDAVAARLERFKLRTDATVTVEAPDTWVAIAVRGPVEVGLDHAVGETVLTLPAPWPGLIGWDVLAPASAHVRLDLPMVDAASLDAVRITCGVPRFGVDVGDGTIPAESGQWVVDASVSFTKGCFVGQELVARIDSRGGNVPRHLRAVVGSRVDAGDEVLNADGAVLGTVTSSAVTAVTGGPVGLVMVGRAVEPDAAVTVRHADGSTSAAVVRAVPLVDDTTAPPSTVSVELG
jgi:tRNA-modifying protein YgfZ